jgi:hypothetical protein
MNMVAANCGWLWQIVAETITPGRYMRQYRHMWAYKTRNPQI